MKAQEIIRDPNEAVIGLDAGDALRDAVFGRRAWKLAQLTALGLPVPAGFALSFGCVREIGAGGAMPALPDLGPPGRLHALRSSPGARAWSGPDALLDIGIGEAAIGALTERLGEAAALDRYRRFIAAFAHAVHGLDPEVFGSGREPGDAAGLRVRIADMLDVFASRCGTAFPQEPKDQLEAAARALARAWQGATARILREARGAPPDAGLGLIVQEMAPGTRAGPDGEGAIQTVDSRTGAPAFEGDFWRFETGYGRALGPRTRLALRDGAAEGGGGGPTLAEIAPDALSALGDACARIARGLGDAYRIAFVLQGGAVAILDAVPVRRNARAAVRIAVDLAKVGAIDRDQALLRIEPLSLVEHLHPQIDPAARRDVFGTGLGASPGAATGRLVFTAEAAQAAAARDEETILARVETSPEDIRGMHSARGVLTMRGGMTSHAAVIARGIGLPCVVGARELKLDAARRSLIAPDGRVFREGALVTLDGTRGEVMAGAPAMIAPELGGAFSELLDWADAARDLGVRANADTPGEARAARGFRVDGIGLCRTEHMFFAAERVGVMREMILAETEEARQAALDRLLPMQRADFVEIFEIMRGLPVTIRLLDPPLHEFLPGGPEEIAEFAAVTGLAAEVVTARARDLAEINPMLGMRGVRLGVVMPAIYAMQARAVFEAAIAVNRDARAPVVPEIMIPLVSANREVELVKARIDAVASAVEAEQDARLAYKLGVMVETPRAALRAGDLAASSAFLSFGTNDLTQMTYGLSRDDAGRFMRDYVNLGLFAEDPFRSLDLEGVGELMLIAASRGRARNPALTLGLCGEHGGDPPSVRFSKLAGFDYVSCSPFRVPIARLAAAQASLLVRAPAVSDDGA